MKVCLLSDSHDRGDLLVAAVEEAVTRGAEAVLHCGDVVAPSTLNRVLRGVTIPIHVIHGNNTGDLVGLLGLAHRSSGRLHYYGQDATLTLGGRRIFMVHYPHYARALALTGDYDLVCCGHEHRVWIEEVANVRGGRTVCVNSGTVGGVGAAAHYLMGDLSSLTFEVFPVPGTAPQIVSA